MIVFQNVCKAYGDRILLDRVSYHCPQGAKIALIGNNGAGKSTLLNILCGLDTSYDGDIARPKDLKLGFLPQEPNPTPKNTVFEEALSGAVTVNELQRERDQILADMAEHFDQDAYDRYEFLEQRFSALNGYRLEEDTRELLTGLGFGEDDVEKSPIHLSGGWRMRLELAKMLLDQPNFLILDEPTNHLDLPSIEWFERYLKNYRGTILFVSHDKDLLNRLPTHVLHLKAGKLVEYKGNFDAFLEAFELKQTQNAQAARNLKQQSDHIQAFVDRFRYKPSKARQVQSRLKMLARLKSLDDGLVHDSLDDTMGLRLHNPHPSGKSVIHLDDVSIGYTTPLVKKLNMRIQRGQKVAILGANGLGKSTLLKTILGRIPALHGEITCGHNVNMGYFAQEHLEGLDERQTILENVLSAAAHLSDMEARRMLGGVGFTRDDVFKYVSVLSGGEKSRTALSCMLARNPNTLILDEPTNHLDLSAIEVLAQALNDYTGTIIFVSHNRSFIEAVATHVIYLKPPHKREMVHMETVEDALGV